MITWQAGDSSKAICPKCQKVVTTTFNLHDLPLSCGVGSVKQIMAGDCDECGSVISIPPQSTPAIQAELSRIRAEQSGF